MGISIQRAKQLGIWSRINPKTQNELKQNLSDSNGATSVKTGKIDPQDILFREIKRHIPEARSEERGLIPNRKFRADIYLPSSGVVIEFDGYRHHALSKNGFKKGLERQNLFVQYGYTMLRYYNEQVKKDLKGVMNQILETHQLRKNGEFKKHVS